MDTETGLMKITTFECPCCGAPARPFRRRFGDGYINVLECEWCGQHGLIEHMVIDIPHPDFIGYGDCSFLTNLSYSTAYTQLVTVSDARLIPGFPVYKDVAMG